MKTNPVIWKTLIAVTICLTPALAWDDNSSKLEGTWLTQASILNCASGTVLRTFSALNTFQPGGTMVDNTSAVSPALRTPGLGAWEKVHGQTYRATTLAFLFNPAGVWSGTQRLSHTIRFNGAVIEFTSTTEIFDTNGVVTTTGCATAVGHRL